MSRQISPFASLTGVEKQIKWLEYQSIRLPYVQVETEKNDLPVSAKQETSPVAEPPQAEPVYERPQPPPEIPRMMPDFQKSRHSQYDAVIARMKQAELQSRHNQSSQLPQQMQ